MIWLLVFISALTLIVVEVCIAFVHLLTPHRFFIMIGKSMRPKMGYLSFGYGLVSNSVNVGDIVAFKRRNKRGGVMHRIIDIDNNGVISIKGDNAPEIDRVTLADIQFKLLWFKNLV